MNRLSRRAIGAALLLAALPVPGFGQLRPPGKTNPFQNIPVTGTIRFRRGNSGAFQGTLSVLRFAAQTGAQTPAQTTTNPGVLSDNRLRNVPEAAKQPSVTLVATISLNGVMTDSFGATQNVSGLQISIPATVKTRPLPSGDPPGLNLPGQPPAAKPGQSPPPATPRSDGGTFELATYVRAQEVQVKSTQTRPGQNPPGGTGQPMPPPSPGVQIPMPPPITGTAPLGGMLIVVGPGASDLGGLSLRIYGTAITLSRQQYSANTKLLDLIDQVNEQLGQPITMGRMAKVGSLMTQIVRAAGQSVAQR